MNKDEMLKDKEQMARIIAFELCPYKYHKEWWGENAKCYSDNNFAHCPRIKEVVDELYNAGYEKIREDEFVLKQSEVAEFRKDQAEVKFLKDKIKQETAREILQEIFTLLHTIKRQDFEDGVPYYSEEVEIFNDRLSEIFNKYGIELEG